MSITGHSSKELNLFNLSEKLNKKWHTMKFEGDVKNKWLMRLGTFDDSSSVSLFFESYIYPTLAVLYVILSIGMVVIFYKHKLMSFVHYVIVVSTLINIIPYILTIPFYVVFYHFANKNAPLPYPWCFIFVILIEYIPKITLSISQCLKLLLAVNRLCSVYFPFKMKYWFSKFRKRVYCIAIIISYLALALPINIIDFPLQKSPCLGDLWNNGNMKVYTACSVLGYAFDTDDPLLSHRFHVIVSIFDFFLFSFVTLLFTAINIAFIVKMRRLTSHRRQALHCNNNSRLNLLNKVYLWVVLVTVVIDIPQHVLIVTISSTYFKLLNGPFDFFISKEKTMVQSCVFIVSKVLSTLDLFIFAFLSRKVRLALKRILCKRNQC